MSYVEKPQLRMVWPQRLISQPPEVETPAGYEIRHYQPGDEQRFYEVMRLAGWPRWDAKRLDYSLSRIIPNGWFMAVEEQSKTVVGTAMCLHNYTGSLPFWGDLGWLACDPAHTGRGLGLALSAAVTSRFIEAGYRKIGLHTEYYRLPAIKIYLKLGFLPMLKGGDAIDLWREVCQKLDWPFTPKAWATASAPNNVLQTTSESAPNGSSEASEN